VPFDHVLIVGAGAIGSVYAAKLAAVSDVCVVARRPHAEAIARRGLRVTGAEERTVSLRASTAVEGVAARTLVLLTTKVHASLAAVGPLIPLLQDDTVILCVQNGLHPESLVRDEIAHRRPDCRALVLRAVTQIGAIFREPGLVELKVMGETTVESHRRSVDVTALLTRGGLSARCASDFGAVVWRKLVANCVINPITSIIGAEVGDIASPRLEPLKRLVVDECVRVARAAGVTVEGDLVRTIDETFGPSRNIASMRQDLMNGRPTEIEHMNGAVVALGRRLGIACPVNAALVALVKAMEGKIADR
jgi:2-dehydropantoate 2-reductase